MAEQYLTLTTGSRETRDAAKGTGVMWKNIAAADNKHGVTQPIGQPQHEPTVAALSAGR